MREESQDFGRVVSSEELLRKLSSRAVKNSEEEDETPACPSGVSHSRETLVVEVRAGV
jgi:hypothetical protein